jgi:hypothetical protein
LALGGGDDGHVEAEGPELAEVGSDLAVPPGVVVMPAGAKVSEPGTGIGQEVPDDDQDRPADGALGLVPAEPP